MPKSPSELAAVVRAEAETSAAIIEKLCGTFGLDPESAATCRQRITDMRDAADMLDGLSKEQAP